MGIMFIRAHRATLAMNVLRIPQTALVSSVAFHGERASGFKSILELGKKPRTCSCPGRMAYKQLQLLTLPGKLLNVWFCPPPLRIITVYN